MASHRTLAAAVSFACTFASLSALPGRAAAFCGFYVSGADAKLFNNATQVVMMRDGTRTVLSMQNNYEGPPEAFAMVVPVPVVLQKENVKTLPKDVFAKVDQMTAPRLVEYWEQDPCGGSDYYGFGGLGLSGIGSGGGGARAAAGPSLGVTVEAKFDVGEYEIVILSAKDSSGLDTWLKQEKYKIPNGAEPYLRPYVAAGSKFFVARVDATRVTFEKGQAQLSPLRFHYDSTEFSLPVRLGLINSSGTQDLIVNILAKERYEAANYPSVTIPTNLDLAEGSKDHFGRFYAALYDRTLEKNPKAVVTEYSWDASSCDPCPGPTLSQADFATLGADALPVEKGAAEAPPAPTPRVTAERATGEASPATLQLVPGRYLSRVQTCWNDAQKGKPKGGRVEVKIAWGEGGTMKEVDVAKNETGDGEIAACVKKSFVGGLMPPDAGRMTVAYTLDNAAPRPTAWRSWTITRLHARYTKEALGEDIVFKAAPAIFGGREVRDEKGALEHGSKPSSGMNNFQGRYAIRHPWIGPMDCKEPRRGNWGGPWHDLGLAHKPPTAAEKVAFVPRGGVTLASFVRTDVPELGVKAGSGPLPVAAAVAAAGAAGGPGAGAGAPGADGRPAPPIVPPQNNTGGCGNCAITMTTDRETRSAALLVLLGITTALARRRR
jgi:hypothetical protein